MNELKKQTWAKVAAGRAFPVAAATAAADRSEEELL